MEDRAPAKKDEFTKIELQSASALLAVMHGKSDSICRLFNKEIVVGKDDIESLNEMMLEKLSLHNRLVENTSLDISFMNKRVIELKSWEDFRQYDFAKIDSPTKSIHIQWDFFIQLDGYQSPQRHTVHVRVSSSPNPSDFFKVLVSGGFDEADDLEIQSSLMLCRVDFVNSALAEELIAVAEKWHELRDPAIGETRKLNKFVYNNREGLARSFEIFFTIFFFGIIGIAFKIYLLPTFHSELIHLFIYLLLAIPVLYRLCIYISGRFGQRIYRSFSGAIDSHVFSLTKGDERQNKKAKERRNVNKEIGLFILNIVASIIISIIFLYIKI